MGIEYTEAEKEMLSYMFHNMDRVIGMCGGEMPINEESISFGDLIALAQKLGIDCNGFLN